MADVLDATVAPDDDVLRRDAQLERGADGAVVEHDRHLEPEFAPVGANVVDRVREAGIDRNDDEIRPGVLEAVLEVRHLLAAGHAPGRPELEVYGLVAVELAEIDGRAVDRLQQQRRRGRTDERPAGALGKSLARVLRTRRGCHAEGAEEHHEADPRAMPHGAPPWATAVVTGAALSFSMNTRIRAGAVGLALADTVWTSPGPS